MDTFTLLAIIINYNLDDAEYSDEGERSYITIIKVKIESYGNLGLRRFEKIHAVGLHKTSTCNDIYKQDPRQTMNKIKNKIKIFFCSNDRDTAEMSRNAICCTMTPRWNNWRGICAENNSR